MKKTANYLPLVILGIMLLNACAREESSDVNQDKIHTAYELFYNANEDKTYARATFKFSNALGTNLKLTSPSEVTFNGDVLTFKDALAYYEKEYAGPISTGTFKWVDTDGNEFENTISLKSINYPTPLDTISRSAAYELFWVGDSLIDNEKVVLTVNGVLEGDAQIFTQDNVNAKSIILALNQLQALGQGNGTLWMDRYFTPALSEKTSAGGLITGRYRPINKSVYLD
ncbi:MAG: hypothetical protein PHT69_00650 [Bacteroidales bacterium]|nr:hypothetical protein [Bacteroidales bacterium]